MPTDDVSDGGTHRVDWVAPVIAVPLLMAWLFLVFRNTDSWQVINISFWAGLFMSGYLGVRVQDAVERRNRRMTS